MSTPTFTVNVFIEHRNGVCVATCLEMGLVATSDSMMALPSVMERLVSRQLTFALENNNPADIFHSADADVWERFRLATEHLKDIDSRTMQRSMKESSWPHLNLKQTSYASAYC
jgi:hypothetical protein